MPSADRASALDKVSCVGSLKTQAWLYSCRGSRLVETHGVQPLWILAFGSMLRNIQHVTAEHLEGLPKALITKLYLAAEAAELTSIRVWQIFLPHLDFCQEFAFCQVKPCSVSTVTYTGSLSDYIVGLQSIAVQWLVDVHIHTSSLGSEEGVIDYAQLGRLANLERLRLTCWDDLYGCINDSDLRRLAWQARELGRFPLLRRLIFNNQPKITDSVFEYLSCFPSLTYCHLVLTGIKHGPQNILRWLEVNYLWGMFDDAESMYRGMPVLSFAVKNTNRHARRVIEIRGDVRAFRRVSGPETRDEFVLEQVTERKPKPAQNHIVKAKKQVPIGAGMF